jgi:hypothetical protein
LQNEEMRGSKILTFLLLVIFGSKSTSAFAQDPEPTAGLGQATSWTAQIIRQKGTPKITRLSTVAKVVSVTMVSSEDRLRPLIEIRFLYDRPGWALYDQNQKLIKQTDRSEWRVGAFLNGRLNEIVIVAKNATGEVERETLFAYSSDAKEFAVVSPWDRITLSVGLTSLDYFQSGFGDFTSSSLVLAGQYATPPDRKSRWGIYSGADLTVLTLIEKPTIGASPNIIQAKGDLTFRLTETKPKRWHVQLLGGMSYLTMLSNGASFGFSNLIAAELGVRTRYTISTKVAVLGDLRLVPIGAFGDISDRGIDLSMTWSRLLLSLRRMEVGLALSNYDYHPDAKTNIKMNLISARLSYSL